MIKPGPNYINKDKASELVEKWGDILDYSSDNVKAIGDDHTRLNTAILLENQERWCITEANVAADGGVFGASLQGSPGQGGAVGNSDFYAQGDARLPKVLIPMIRRTFPELITNEIVGVQPMSGPVGLAFALRYKYQKDSLGNAGACQDGGTCTSHGPNGGAKQFEGVTTWYGNSAEMGYQNLDTRFTGASSAALSGLGSSGTDFDFIGEDSGVADILANFEFTSQIPQMEISFEKTAVEAGTRRLAAKWSVELEQDIRNMNGIDIDAELTNAMSYEIQAEIDREMIMRMVQVALKAGASQGYSLWYAACADARWLGERNRDFYAKVIVEANRVAIRNRRGAANFIVATPRVCAMLEMLPEFKYMDVNGNVNTQPVGIAKVGSVGGRFSVYRDTRTEAQWMVGKRSNLEYALLGYKGSEYYDTGIIYCPYIPVMVQRTIGPNDFAPRVGLLTR
ncbi:MAG: hypothetical protein GY861_16785, partial [bacterium]|nr:hypothetical protein [bacterium]